MKKIISVLSVFLLFAFNVMSQTTIKIDGFFDDWGTNINTFIDDVMSSFKYLKNKKLKG